jgi:hypothetical protein
MLVILGGPFSDDDVRHFTDLLRAIEQRQPDEVFSLVMADDRGVEEAKDFVEELLARRPRMN